MSLIPQQLYVIIFLTHTVIYLESQDLESLALLAGFTGTAILGEMHAFRARDPRIDDIGEGMSPCQVSLRCIVLCTVAL